MKLVESFKKGYEHGIKIDNVTRVVISENPGIHGQALIQAVKNRGEDLTKLHIEFKMTPEHIGSTVAGFVRSWH